MIEAFVYIVDLQFSENRTIKMIFDDILKVKGVQRVKIVFGSYDAVAVVTAETTEGIARAAVSIGSVQGVRGTSTQILSEPV